jgi:F0F1-type ATP synthase epsilon subunit
MNPNQPDPSAPRILKVHISSPDKVYYDGEAEALTAINDQGPFDVLPFHENFISIVYDKVTIHKHIEKEKVDFPIESGVMKIEKNNVSILTGFELLEDNVIPKIEKKIIKPKSWFNIFSHFGKE